MVGVVPGRGARAGVLLHDGAGVGAPADGGVHEGSQDISASNEGEVREALAIAERAGDEDLVVAVVHATGGGAGGLLRVDVAEGAVGVPGAGLVDGIKESARADADHGLVVVPRGGLDVEVATDEEVGAGGKSRGVGADALSLGEFAGLLDGAIAGLEMPAVEVHLGAGARAVSNEADVPTLVVARGLCGAGADVDGAAREAAGRVGEGAPERGDVEKLDLRGSVEEGVAGVALVGDVLPRGPITGGAAGGVQEHEKRSDVGLSGGLVRTCNWIGGGRAALKDFLRHEDVGGHLHAVGGDAVERRLEGRAACGDGRGAPVGDVPLSDAKLGQRA